MSKSKARTVAVLAMHGVLPFDLATPCEIFGRVRLANDDEGYHIRVCGEAKHVKAGLVNLRVSWDLTQLADADTVLVPGLADPTTPVSKETVAALCQAAARGTRIASICTGAFVLAAAGLLDGLRATTHWLAAPELAKRYPATRVDPNVLYVDNGQILTSAGAAAGLDMCLHMVRRDYGATVAANTARLAVMPLEREGGQAQFIVNKSHAYGTTLDPVLRWMEQHLAEPLNLEEIARRARWSTRTLSRRFREQTGTTPGQWLLSARMRRAQQLLETTDLSVEQVATEVGFDSVSAFRDRFHRQLSTSPAAYRRSFRSVHVSTRAEHRAQALRG